MKYILYLETLIVLTKVPLQNKKKTYVDYGIIWFFAVYLDTIGLSLSVIYNYNQAIKQCNAPVTFLSAGQDEPIGSVGVF